MTKGDMETASNGYSFTKLVCEEKVRDGYTSRFFFFFFGMLRWRDPQKIEFEDPRESGES